MSDMTDQKRYSPACERNKDVILDVLREVMPTMVRPRITADRGASKLNRNAAASTRARAQGSRAAKVGVIEPAQLS